MSKRQLSPYELTQLAKYGLSPAIISAHGDKPIEYVTQHVEFAEHTFHIDQRAIIPRVETEELVQLASTHAQTLSKEKPISIVEIGTGCGAVGISLAHKLNRGGIKFSLLATDISAEALELAKENFRQLQRPLPIVFKNMNLLRNPPLAFKAVDIIIANLPYIPTARIELLDKSVKNYEPWIALDGGIDGFALVRRFLKQAATRIKTNGVIYLEIDYTHPDLLKQEFGHTFQIITWVSQISRCTFAQLKLLKIPQ